MQALKSFSQTELSFSLEVDVQAVGTIFEFAYRLRNFERLTGLPAQQLNLKGSEIERRDGLWQHTCFEAFLNPVGSDSYYELNFSLDPAWNSYSFDQYRQPQPPRVTQDFSFESLQWDSRQGLLQVQVRNSTKHQKFRIGLTAVIEEKSGQKHYLALAHAGSKADFHLSDSFIITRG